MLVLDRYKNENLVIGEGADRINITILDVRNGVVSLGVQAPRDVPIMRGELLQPKGADDEKLGQ